MRLKANFFILIFNMKYLIRISLFLISFFPIWVALFYLQLGAPTMSSEWIEQAYDLKKKRASSCTVPKVLIVSGSGSLFGFNSQLIEEALNRPVINFGVAVGLRLPYILEQTKSVLSKDDIVILPLEYYLYGDADEYTTTLLDYIVSRDPNYFNALPLFEKVNVIVRLPLSRLLSGIKNAIKPTWYPCKGLYCIENMSPWGDQINIEPEQRTAFDVERLRSWQDIAIYPDITKRSKKTLTDFQTWANEKGVKLVMIPMHVIDNPSYHTQKGQDFFNKIRSFANAQGILFVGDVYGHMYDKQYFFNGEYHLNSIGVAQNTQRMIKELQSSDIFASEMLAVNN